jgi:cell division protein FtsI/penicillin-binding protein 2
MKARNARAARPTRTLRDHGWFVFMVPKDNPEIAGVVFSEHGEHGLFQRHRREARDSNLLRAA